MINVFNGNVLSLNCNLICSVIEIHIYIYIHYTQIDSKSPSRTVQLNNKPTPMPMRTVALILYIQGI